MRKLIYLCYLIFVSSAMRIYAQCPRPTSFGTVAVVPASCPGNGLIAITGMTPSLSAAQYQFMLMNAAGTQVIKPWQNNDTIFSVEAGTYKLYARTICSNGFSDSLLRTPDIVVSNNYQPSNITGITVNNNDVCNDGKITIAGTGSTPRAYALVSSLNELDPPAGYVKPPSAYNVFDSLTGGIYYVRMYDRCGGYHTQAVNVPRQDSGAYIANSYTLNKYGCDSFRFSTSFYNLNKRNYRVWVNWPNGTTDTFNYSNATAESGSQTFGFGIRKLDSFYTAGTFPDNISTWPKNITVTVEDFCKNTSTKTYTINKPLVPRITTVNTNTGYGSNCDSIAVRFRISYTSGSLTSYTNVLWNNTVRYSLDDGATWRPGSSSSTYINTSDYLVLPRGGALTLKVAYCGDTLTQSFTTAAKPLMAVSLNEYNLGSCYTRSGISISGATNTNADSIRISILSQPAGANLTDTIIPYNSSTLYLSNWLNLPPGSYSVQLSDSGFVDCPSTIVRNITLSHPLQLNYSYYYDCNANLVIYTTSLYRSGSNQRLSSALKAVITDLSGNKISTTTYHAGTISGVTGDTTVIRIPATTMQNIPNGDYLLKVWVDRLANSPDNDTCNMTEQPFRKDEIFLNLSKSYKLNGCVEDAQTSTAIGLAEGGLAPYSWALFRDSIHISNLVAGPSASNIFNNLNTNNTYYLQVNDQCGRGNNIILNSSIARVPMYVNSHSLMPCVGDNVTLSVDRYDNVTYQWYKNNDLIPDATGNSFTLTNIQDPADSGRYKVSMKAGDCSIFSSEQLIDPGLCGQPLPLQLVAFFGYGSNRKAHLFWHTVNEKDHKGFYVERSSNGQHWEMLDFLPARGNNGIGKNEYSYTDNGISLPQYFYRLKSAGLDGSTEYSTVIHIRFTSGQPDLSVFPNPVTESYTRVYNAAQAPLDLYNAQGTLIRSFIPDSEQFRLDLSDLNPGIYLIKSRNDQQTVKLNVLH